MPIKGKKWRRCDNCRKRLNEYYLEGTLDGLQVEVCSAKCQDELLTTQETEETEK